MSRQIDPVCNLPIEEEEAAGSSEYAGLTYYFHSEECMGRFNQNPAKFAGTSSTNVSDAPALKRNE